MIKTSDAYCPLCGGELKYYDTVGRTVLGKMRKPYRVTLRRLRCLHCGIVHRELPDYISPYKHYEAEIIRGVYEGFITCETYGFEDYPCETTMKRWRSRNSQGLL